MIGTATMLTIAVAALPIPYANVSLASRGRRRGSTSSITGGQLTLRSGRTFTASAFARVRMPTTLQRTIAFVAALGAAPLIAALGVAIRLETRGPTIFRAERVGRGGRPFKCLKLRTMRVDGTGSAVTGLGDRRITRVGRILRRFRLDELPQLWNVACGEMLLVGPRPEDPRFVDLTDPLHREVFSATPGITGLTQLAFAREADLLDPLDPEGSYRHLVLPSKVALDARYLERRSVRLDAWILYRTIGTALGRSPTLAEIEAHL